MTKNRRLMKIINFTPFQYWWPRGEPPIIMMYCINVRFSCVVAIWGQLTLSGQSRNSIRLIQDRSDFWASSLLFYVHQYMCQWSVLTWFRSIHSRVLMRLANFTLSLRRETKFWDALWSDRMAPAIKGNDKTWAQKQICLSNVQLKTFRTEYYMQTLNFIQSVDGPMKNLWWGKNLWWVNFYWKLTFVGASANHFLLFCIVQKSFAWDILCS